MNVMNTVGKMQCDERILSIMQQSLVTGTPLMKKIKPVHWKHLDHIFTLTNMMKRLTKILDLRYEARTVEQKLTNPEKVDQWFDAKTQGLNDIAKAKLKRKWGTMQRCYSEPRLKIIADEILFDMQTKPRLVSGQGNAMLVASGIPEAYKHKNQQFLGKQCAIVTS